MARAALLAVTVITTLGTLFCFHIKTKQKHHDHIYLNLNRIAKAKSNRAWSYGLNQKLMEKAGV